MSGGTGKEEFQIEDWATRSKLIFIGTVKRRKAATASIPAGDNTVVARVEELIVAPEMFQHLKDRELTIRVRNAEKVVLEKRTVFFANIWRYGQTVGVVEAGSMPETDAIDFRGRINHALKTQSDAVLTKRIERSELIILGKVADVRPITDMAKVPIMTEHAPDWWEAKVEVESVIKGQLPGRTVTVVYPKSKDEMWIDSPKFDVGHEGVWILQKDQAEKGPPKLRTPGFTALDALDFRPRGDLERIVSLFKQSKG